jgi:RNA polymerase sigma-70 factor (ECF subfamily)
MSLFSSATGPSADWKSVGEIDWDAVYKDQLPRVFNYFRFRLGPGADAEDLTSRTFEKAWRARTRFRRDRAGFSTWLLKIAHNVGTDYLRSQRSHLPLEAAADVASADSPYDRAARDSDLAKLSKLMVKLPERERELIALKYGAAIGNQAIARLTGLSESNVGVILHRAVQTLRSQW